MSQIAPADWSALLDYADAIDFSRRPEPEPAGPSDRIFHLAITAGNRSRELAVNDPFETPRLARLIALTQRAVRDRQVRSPETLDDVQSVALATAWLDAQAADPDDDPAADEQNKCMTDDPATGCVRRRYHTTESRFAAPRRTSSTPSTWWVSGRSRSRSNDRPAIRARYIRLVDRQTR